MPLRPGHGRDDGRAPGPDSAALPPGETGSASRLYSDAPGVCILNRMAAETVAQALRRLPIGRTLRVLEIGAGTGSTTAALLERLPSDRIRYVFTDVSPRFLTAARERFAGEEPFDLVVPTNVLYATRNLAHSLRRGRGLAAPGALLLIEGTPPIRTIDLIFGFTDGWWRFADTALRPDYPLIWPVAWSALLPRSGFSGAAALALPCALWGVLARHALVLACADDAPADVEAPPQWLLLPDRQGVARPLAARHAVRGGACIDVRPGQDLAATLAALDAAQPLEVLDLGELEPQVDAAEVAHAVCADAL